MKFSNNSEVAEAFERNLPVVALESTVIAHGLPYPHNLNTARAMEAVVRTEGAVPATIAVLSGIPTVGLSDSQLEHLARAPEIRKVSIRDLPVAASRKLDGATTVASTMYYAYRAGIGVLATGGIGGIHRGDAGDVSADLPVIATTPMITVCAGAKIVLDLEATREWLETNGVCVLGWESNEFPAFYSRTSGLAVDGRVDSVEEVLSAAKARDELEMQSAILLTVPVPEDDEIDSAVLEAALAEALVEAQNAGIKGKDATPFLLSRMSELSGGETLNCNVALLINNAKIAAKIAVGLSRD